MVSALGPRFGEEGSSSEVVDFKGVESAIEAAEAFLPSDSSPSSAEDERVLISPGEESGETGPGGAWQPLDDVIMGGRSSSSWKAGVGRGVLERQSGRTFGRWSGTLVTEGGGFCGTIVKVHKSPRPEVFCCCYLLAVLIVVLQTDSRREKDTCFVSVVESLWTIIYHGTVLRYDTV